MNLNLEEYLKDTGWLPLFREFFSSNKSTDLKRFLNELKGLRKTKNIFPDREDVFRAFKSTPYNKVKVVILGQDPYCCHNLSNGLAFGVKKGQLRPLALRNIIKEVSVNIKEFIPKHCSTLEGWADQGVLLLNCSLTVEEGSPGSHRCGGWEDLISFILQKLNKESKGLVFILCGSYAQLIANNLKSYYNLTLKTSHPDSSGFFGCEVFTKTNDFLIKSNKEAINWFMIDKEKRNSLYDFLLLNQRKEGVK